MKKKRIGYWITTGLIFTFDGLIPAFTSNTEMAIEGIRHLGYPDYFRVLLTFFKVSGALILILPIFKGRIKEWAYAGFSFNFVCALISGLVVDGPGVQMTAPLLAMALLGASYYYYHRLQREPIRFHNAPATDIQFS